VLSYVYATLTPFHAEQLREVLAIDDETGRLDRRKAPEFRVLMKACAGLISYSNANDVVIPAHHSAVLFLEKDGEFKMRTSRRALGTLCVRHLTGPDYDLKIVPSNTRTVPLEFNSSTVIQNLNIPLISGLFKPRAANRVHFRAPATFQTHDLGLSPAFHYARENWALLTRDIKPVSSSWSLFEELALGKGKSWNVHPWKPLGQSLNSHYQGLLGWSIANHHLPLLEVLIDAEPRPEIFTLPLPQYDLGDATVVRTPLQLAVSVKSLPAFRMLSPLALVREDDKKRRILLHLAASVGFDELIDEYARHGWISSLDGSAIIEAAKHGHEKFTVRLLGRSDSLTNRDSYQALRMASRNGHSSAVQTLLSRCKLPFEVQDCDSTSTPLEEAISNGHSDIVRVFYRMETAMHSKYTDRKHVEAEQLLYSAAVSGDCPSVETLLKGGVNTNACSSMFESASKPLDEDHFNMAETNRHLWSRKLNHPTIVEPPLYGAVRNGHLSIVQTMLEYGGDASRKFYGTSLLHIASERGNLKILEALLDAPSAPCVDCNDSSYRTSLMVAAARCHKVVVEYLLEKGACKDATGNSSTRPWEYNWTALMEACAGNPDQGKPEKQTNLENTRVQTVALLCEHGADVNVQSSHGETAFILAAAQGDMDSMRVLVLHKADVHAKGYTGNALTMLLSSYIDPGLWMECMRYLADRGLQLEEQRLPSPRKVFNISHRIHMVKQYRNDVRRRYQDFEFSS
jgi:ankyrin repeat protein